MNLFSRLWAALSRVIASADGLADSLDGLSATFRQANDNVRANLALPSPEPAALPAPAEEPKKGRKDRP